MTEQPNRRSRGSARSTTSPVDRPRRRFDRSAVRCITADALGDDPCASEQLGLRELVDELTQAELLAGARVVAECIGGDTTNGTPVKPSPGAIDRRSGRARGASRPSIRLFCHPGATPPELAGRV